MPNFSEIEAFYNYFEKLGPQFDLALATNKGTYFPASILHIASILDDLIQKNIVQRRQYFLDAGSGDGRIVALASAMGFKAFGIEYNDDIYSSSVNHIENLFEKGLLDKKPNLILGDFLDDEVYSKIKLEFKDFDVIFNFNTQPYQLVNKICLESTQKTVFIFNSIRQVLEPNSCLKLIEKEYFQEIHQLLNIYEKV